MARPEHDDDMERDGPVIRDNRRIDPETFQARTQESGEPTVEEAEKRESEAAAPEPTQPSDEETQAGLAAQEELAAVQQQLAERTADLQRVQAEYANYRKRVDRDRAAVRDQALIQVLGELLPVLDDIGRAREHDELTGGFKSVGESLEALVAKLGLEKYGEPGDAFDPTVHEALTMVPTPGLSTPTVIEVFQPGYRVEERVVRPARVVVGGPADEPEAAAPAQTPAEDNGPAGDSTNDTADTAAAGEEADGSGDAADSTEGNRE